MNRWVKTRLLEVIIDRLFWKNLFTCKGVAKWGGGFKGMEQIVLCFD